MAGLQESGTLRTRKGRGTRSHERRSERSLQDRYNGVVQHWTELSPGQRQHLLSVPMQSMLEGTLALYWCCSAQCHGFQWHPFCRACRQDRHLHAFPGFNNVALVHYDWTTAMSLPRRCEDALRGTSAGTMHDGWRASTHWQLLEWKALHRSLLQCSCCALPSTNDPGPSSTLMS